MKITLTALIVYGLAAYRLTRLIVEDSITEPARNWVKNRAYILMIEETTRETRVDTISPFFALVFRLISCFWCVGFWIAVIVTILAVTQGRWWALTCFALAIAALVGEIREHR